MREFIITHPVTLKPVVVRQGIIGFTEFQGSQDAADAINKYNGNTERDLEIAEGCSMFGWDTPLADMISNGGV